MQRVSFFFASYETEPDKRLSPKEQKKEIQSNSEGSFLGIPSMIHTTPLIVAGDFHGYARFYYNLQELHRQRQITFLLISALILTLLAGILLFISRILSYQVTQHLTELSGVMEKVGAGELGRQVDINCSNEIGTIAKIFNVMSRENADMYRKLADINNSLEKQVILRTEELQKSQDLLESVLNSSHDGIMVLKTVKTEHGEIEDFEWIMANPRASANFAVEVSEIIGKKILTRYPSLKDEEIYTDFLQAAREKKPFVKEKYLEFENLRGWFQVSVRIIGEGLAVTFHDITQSKTLQMDLEKQVSLDGLTQISNRGYFDREMEAQWSLCREESRNIALLFIDVDFFKKYNDTYGHGMGDECLQILARILADHASRPLDCAARYGGEEFVILLPRTERKGAEKIALAIQKDLKELAVPNQGSEVSDLVTISIGIAHAIPGPGQTASQFVETADQALYESKKNGRNRYTFKDYN